MSAKDDDILDLGETEEVPTLNLPLDGWHRAKGGRMVEFAGYYMPVQYAIENGGGGIIAEHLWTRENAGLFDVSHMGQLFISGNGAQSALEALLPADLASLKLGALRYSLLLDEHGGILDDLMVARWSDGFYIVVNGATKWDDIGHMREHLPDAITINHLEDRILLALQGPKAAEALERVVTGAQPLSSLTFMKGGLFKIAGAAAWISRSGYTGEDGFEISVLASRAKAVADLLVAQPEVRPIGLGARDSLRLEAGLPLYGHDLSEKTDPVSAGLGFALSKRRRDKGGFPGADQILKLLAKGAPATRVGLELEGRRAAREGDVVFNGKREVGGVTSGGFSPTLEHPIAMAYVNKAVATPGTKLEIENRGKRLTATVVPMPFVPHKYHR